MTEQSADQKSGYYLLNTDGGNHGDRLGPAAIGALLRTTDLATVDKISKPIKPATHNEAEYKGLIEGLTLAHKHGVRHIRVFMDSELVVDQINGDSAVKESRLIELHEAASTLRTLFGSFRISWVPRKLNEEADQLVNEALDASD